MVVISLEFDQIVFELKKESYKQKQIEIAMRAKEEFGEEFESSGDLQSESCHTSSQKSAQVLDE
jgi:hypothetical protein